MNPKMGLNVDVLNCIQKCSQPSNGSLSMLALRCLISLSPFHLGESMVMSNFTCVCDSAWYKFWSEKTRQFYVMLRFNASYTFVFNFILFYLDSSCYSYFIKMLPVWLDIIVNGSRSCVKMAIRCVALHSSTARDENLAKVLDVSTSPPFFCARHVYTFCSNLIFFLNLISFSLYNSQF